MRVWQQAGVPVPCMCVRICVCVCVCVCHTQVLRYQGKYGDAEPLQRQAVELSEDIQGKVSDTHTHTQTHALTRSALLLSLLPWPLYLYPTRI